MGLLAVEFGVSVRSTKDVIESLMARAHANDHVAETQTKICQSYQKVADLVQGGSLTPDQVREERAANIALNKSGLRALAWSNDIAEQKGSKVRLLPSSALDNTAYLIDNDEFELS